MQNQCNGEAMDLGQPIHHQGFQQWRVRGGSSAGSGIDRWAAGIDADQERGILRGQRRDFIPAVLG
jgi:hypothetical protein